jgi:hypothetical protein
MLHAAELGFVHPVRDDPMKFEAALPPDFEAFLARLSTGETDPRPGRR